jgi:hypothetical protein
MNQTILFDLKRFIICTFLCVTFFYKDKLIARIPLVSATASSSIDTGNRNLFPKVGDQSTCLSPVGLGSRATQSGVEKRQPAPNQPEANAIRKEINLQTASSRERVR